MAVAFGPAPCEDLPVSFTCGVCTHINTVSIRVWTLPRGFCYTSNSTHTRGLYTHNTIVHSFSHSHSHSLLPLSRLPTPIPVVFPIEVSILGPSIPLAVTELPTRVFWGELLECQTSHRSDRPVASTLPISWQQPVSFHIPPALQ